MGRNGPQGRRKASALSNPEFACCAKCLSASCLGGIQLTNGCCYNRHRSTLIDYRPIPRTRDLPENSLTHATLATNNRPVSSSVYYHFAVSSLAALALHTAAAQAQSDAGRDAAIAVFADAAASTSTDAAVPTDTPTVATATTIAAATADASAPASSPASASASAPATPPAPAPTPTPAPIGGAWSPHPARPLSVVGAPGRGVTLTTGDDFFSLTLRGRLQVRDTLLVPTAAFSSTTPETLITHELSLRTVRLIFSGHMYSRQIQYLLQLALAPRDFEANSVSPVFDGWIALNQLRDLQLRIGQFFVPFDRARTNAEWGLNMIDRPLLVSEATLDRDVGAELSSNDLGGLGVLAYRLGVFAGEGKNRLAASPGFLYVARLQVNPFGAFDDSVEGDQQRTRSIRLALGLAGAFNHRASRSQSTNGTSYQLATFDYGHFAADATVKFRGLYLFGELLYRQATRDQSTATLTTTMPPMPLTEYSRSLWGYIAQAGYMLTSRLELTARWEQAFALGATDPALIAQMRSQSKAMGLGLNWYQAGHGFKVQTDYQYMFGDAIEQGRSQLRVQLQLSF